MIVNARKKEKNQQSLRLAAECVREVKEPIFSRDRDIDAEDIAFRLPTLFLDKLDMNLSFLFYIGRVSD